MVHNPPRDVIPKRPRARNRHALAAVAEAAISRAATVNVSGHRHRCIASRRVAPMVSDATEGGGERNSDRRCRRVAEDT